MQTGALWLAGLAWLLPAFSAGAVNVVVLLRNGDRITGELVAQETNHVVIQTGWAGRLSLPVPTIGGLRTVSGEDLLRAAAAVAAPPARNGAWVSGATTLTAVTASRVPSMSKRPIGVSMVT